MIDITDVILHKMKTRSIFIYIYVDMYIYIYIYIIEFKQIGFSSEVSLMYKQEKGLSKRKNGGCMMRKITLTEVLQCAVCGAVRVLPETRWAHHCRPSFQSL